MADLLPCCDCGEPVVEFSAPNDLWNAVMRPDGHEHDREYLCLPCFLNHVAYYARIKEATIALLDGRISFHPYSFSRLINEKWALYHYGSSVQADGESEPYFTFNRIDTLVDWVLTHGESYSKADIERRFSERDWERFPVFALPEALRG